MHFPQSSTNNVECLSFAGLPSVYPVSETAVTVCTSVVPF